MSNQVKSKEKVHMDPKYLITLTVTLFITCVIVAGLLGGVNAITKDKIAAINWETVSYTHLRGTEDRHGLRLRRGGAQERGVPHRHPRQLPV